MLFLGVALVLATAAQSSTTVSPTPAQAFADLNQWRVQAGEPRVLRFTSAYDSACAAHDNYMNLFGRLTHPEDRSRAGYTLAGADTGLNSVLALPEGLPKDTWVDAVYHRMGARSNRVCAFQGLPPRRVTSACGPAAPRSTTRRAQGPRS